MMFKKTDCHSGHCNIEFRPLHLWFDAVDNETTELYNFNLIEYSIDDINKKILMWNILSTVRGWQAT